MHYKGFSAWQFLYGFFKKYKSYGLVFLILSIMWSLQKVYRPYLLKILVDKAAFSFENTESLQSFKYYLWFYIALLGISYGSFIVQDALWVRFFCRLKKDVGSLLCNKLLHLSPSFYMNHLSGSLGSYVQGCVQTTPRLIHIINEEFLRSILGLSMAAYILSTVGYKFALALGIWALSYLLLCFYNAPLIRQSSMKVSEESSKCMGRLVDVVGNILNVKLFNRETFEAQALDQHYTQWMNQTYHRDEILIKIFLYQNLGFFLFQGMCCYWLFEGIQEQTTTPGDFALIFLISLSFHQHFSGFARVLADFSEGMGTLSHNLNQLAYFESLPPSSSLTLPFLKGDITFEKVNFSHKDIQEPLFKNLSITLKEREKVGLVGFSGSGKSSFVHLLLRLFDPTHGHICIGGDTIQDISLKAIREHMAFVPQDPTLFHRSIFENIAYGRLDATEKEVFDVAKQVKLHEFIQSLPQGYATFVGERGVKLSGGQRQRMALARALLSKASVFIMDEATSQLDTLTERYIQSHIWDVLEQKTTLVIAHRLSTLLHMDRILVFDKGRIVEDGSHASLLQTHGLYKKLWDAQKQGFLPHKPKHCA
jgi:ATP-binding cassette subfamily B protein